jgi:hypothetical protein
MSRFRERPILVLLGKPYTMHDSYLNMGMARHLSVSASTMLPMDCLPLDDVELGSRYTTGFPGLSRGIWFVQRYQFENVPNAYPAHHFQLWMRS